MDGGQASRILLSCTAWEIEDKFYSIALNAGKAMASATYSYPFVCAGFYEKPPLNLDLQGLLWLMNSSSFLERLNLVRFVKSVELFSCLTALC